MRKLSWKCLAVGAALLIVLPGASSAFDGDRAGFIFGLGLGLGKATQSADASESFGGADVSVGIDISNTGVATDFKLGGGVNEKVWVYYHSRSIFYTYDFEFEDPWSGSSFSESITTVQGISGIGVSYFLEPEAPSFFFTGTLGAGGIVEMSDGDSGGEVGLGFEIGAGYEFSPSFFVEAAIMRAVLDEMAGAEFSVSNALVTVSWVGY